MPEPTFRDRVLAFPARVGLAAFLVTMLGVWVMEDAYRALNLEDPDEVGGQVRLIACVVVCVLALAGGAWLLGRSAFWLLLPGAAGLLLLFGMLEDAWGRWGMNWEDGLILMPAVVIGFLLFAPAAWGVRRSLGPIRASQGALHAMAFFLLPTLLFALALLARFQDVASQADEQWTAAHGDPALGAVAVGAAVTLALLWRGRRA